MRIFWKPGSSALMPQIYTWYECPNGKLAAIVNVTDKPITTKVDVKALNIADGTVYDEYRNQAYQLKNGKFTATIKARNFILIGLPAKARFPWKDDFAFTWFRVLGNRLSAVGTPQLAIETNDFGMHRTAAPALGAWPIGGDFAGVKGEGGKNFSYGKFVPVRTDKAMTATVWCRSKNAAAQADIYMKIIVLDKDNKPISGYFTAKATGKHAVDWEKLQVKIPSVPGATWLHVILHASAGGREGQIVFDDFTLE